MTYDSSDIAILYEGFNDVPNPTETIEKMLKGINNYYQGLKQDVEREPNDMGKAKDLEDLSKYLVKHLAWASQFPSLEDRM